MTFIEDMKFTWVPKSHARIPSLIVTNDGTVLAFCNDRKDSPQDNANEIDLVMIRKKPGCDWEPMVRLVSHEGWQNYIGSAVYDPAVDKVMVTFGRCPVSMDEWKIYSEEEKAEIHRKMMEKSKRDGIEPGEYILISFDCGDTWLCTCRVSLPARVTHEDGTVHDVISSCHGSAHGIVLTKGEHKGRIVCPSRFQIGDYDSHDYIRFHVYNNCIYSDDNGITWVVSQPVQIGTGEGTLIEREDGSLLYNSRAYYHDGLRRTAVSRDGGVTWGEFSEDQTLREDTYQGCNASFIRVERNKIAAADRFFPKDAKAITLFVNPHSDKRANLTAHVSFDDGASWCHSKCIWPGDAGYSSLEWNPVDQRFHLMYERCEHNPNRIGIMLAEFDMEWLMSK